MLTWSDRYFKMQSPDGTEFVVDRFESRERQYKKMARAFVNYTQMHGLTFYKHITLTQKRESYKPNFLNNFMNSLRRRYGRIEFLRTTEVQGGRLERTGEHVLHWHMICAFESGTEFSREDIEKIQLYWKFGNVDIKPVPARRLSLNYLLKYINKTFQSLRDVELRGVRLVQMSRIPYFYRWVKSRVFRVLEFFKLDLDFMESFRSNNRGIFYEVKSPYGFRSEKCYVYDFGQHRILESINALPDF